MAVALLCPHPPVVSAQSDQRRDGAHDFDFIIGDCRAHVGPRPDRLEGLSSWVQHDGKFRLTKILDSIAKFEQYEVDDLKKTLPTTGQTTQLRL